MGNLFRRDFSRGWFPSADSVNCPKNALLRADNCVLDELGILSVRPGSAKINSSVLASTDVHSLFTVYLSGARYRMAGVTDDIYSNGASLGQTMAGSGDVAFGSGMGQILFARSTSKKKYDGSTVRNWGIAQPNAAPTVAAVAADSKTFSLCVTADYANWTQTEGTKADQTTYIQVTPATVTGRGTITKVFASPTDFTVYDAFQVATDDDLLDFYFLVTEPQLLQFLRVQIDVNGGDFSEDYYYYDWTPYAPISAIDNGASIVDYNVNSYSWAEVRAKLEEQGVDTSVLNAAINPVLGASTWNHLSVRRGDMNRVGNTTGKNWSTVKAIQLVTQCSAATIVGFKTIKMVGGANRTLTGKYKWAVVAVRDTASYEGKSKPSDFSAEIELKAQACSATVAQSVVTALIAEGNATHLWLFRRGGVMDDWYRVSTAAVPSPSAAVVFTDTMSDRDAMAANIKMQTDVEMPPDNIIGIVGPHFDRMFCLTSTMLYPSRKLDLDSYAALQAITICGAEETAYWVVKLGQELFIGTSRDIYRLSGYGDESNDGKLDFTKVGIGIGNPPISPAIAQEGNTLVYLASDGWRIFTGTDSAPVRGDTDLLWRGYTRHGVSPINVSGSTARFKAAISKGVLSAITPEGSNTTYSSVLHRLSIAQQRWYRHVYSPSWRSIYREPDGTLIAGDNAGFVWVLDSGTQDDGADIPIEIWSPIDDNDQPYTPKVPLMHRVRLNTGGAAASIDLHLDGSSVSSKTVSTSQSSMGTAESSVAGLQTFKQIQHRITGSFSVFKLMDLWLDYKDRPIGRYVWDLDIDTGTQDLTWIREVRIKVLAGGLLTITPYFDGTAFPAYTATPVSTVDPVIVPVPVGREYKGRTPRLVVTSTYEFFPYWAEILYRGSGNVSGKKRQRISA